MLAHFMVFSSFKNVLVLYVEQAFYFLTNHKLV